MRLISVQDDEGKIKYDRQEIVDVFASFYDALYARRTDEKKHVTSSLTNPGIPEVTIKEVTKQLNLMKNGKCADFAGIVAEML